MGDWEPNICQWEAQCLMVEVGGGGVRGWSQTPIGRKFTVVRLACEKLHFQFRSSKLKRSVEKLEKKRKKRNVAFHKRFPEAQFC